MACDSFCRTNKSIMNSPPNPAIIFQLATGYWASATLLAAQELGIFPALAAGPQTAAQVASQITAHPDATARLLNACCGLGLLAKQTDQYELAPVAAAFLIPGRPGYLGSALRWSAEQYPAWGQLATATRQGGPVVQPAWHLGEDPIKTRQFVLAMHERAAGVARGVVGFLDVAGCQDMLDVGGGPGTYATLLAQQHPTLHITIRDLPGIVAVAQELVAASPAATRIHFQPGDGTTGDYGHDQYDAVLFAGVLHQMNPATIQQMFRGAHHALRPGGRVLICDMLLDDTGTQPLFSALFSLQMLLTSANGATFTEPDCRQWLATAGFHNLATKHLLPQLPYTIVTGHKPASSTNPRD